MHRLAEIRPLPDAVNPVIEATDGSGIKMALSLFDVPSSLMIDLVDGSINFSFRYLGDDEKTIIHEAGIISIFHARSSGRIYRIAINRDSARKYAGPDLDENIIIQCLLDCIDTYRSKFRRLRCRSDQAIANIFNHHASEITAIVRRVLSS